MSGGIGIRDIMPVPDPVRTDAILPFGRRIAPFILERVAPMDASGLGLSVHKGSGMSFFRPIRQRARFRYACEGERGFTLIELMVTLGVVAIIAAIAAPAMQSLINASRLNGMSEEVTAAMQLARSEAVRRGAPVTVCSSANGTACTASTDWSRWIVIGRDNAASAGGTEVIDVIRDTTTPAGLQLGGPAAGIRFNPSGLTNAERALTVCMPTGKPAENRRVVTVLISGAARTAKVNGGGSC